ncbi:MAG TPA: endonuclease III [Acidobacteriota bacterium]|nr:endonuclease III [Acidobacteriota bacterium]
MDKKKQVARFIEIFELAHARYGRNTYRLAGEGWEHHWQTLVATIMSAQTRDETTIPVAENLFKKYPTLSSLSKADVHEVLAIIKRVNYSPTKARHIVATANELLQKFNGEVPKTIDELITLPGVGRKTANLIVAECYGDDSICVDTHVHRIANLMGIVKTKTPHDTEMALRELVPKKYWSKINRLFVLWGKEAPGHDAEYLLGVLNGKIK